MFEIGQVLTKENYTQGAIWCNQNGAHIEKQGNHYAIVANVQPTPEELKSVKIAELKRSLADTDYKALKFAEGILTEEEYKPTREQRELWRAEINKLEEDQ